MSLYKDASLVMIPSAYKDGKLYSIKPVPEYGAELVTNGDFANGSTNWTGYTTGSSTIVFTDVAILNIDASNSNVGIYQENVFTSGKKYKIVLKMKASSSFDAEVLETQQASTRATIGSVSLTTSYQDFTFDFEATGNNDIFIHRKFGESSANQSITIDNVSVKEVLVNGDFTFSRGSNLAATRVDVNGLIEKGRENLLLRSNELDSGSWAKDDVTLTSGQTGYDGSSDAFLMKQNTNASRHHLIQGISFSGVGTFSIYAKQKELQYLQIASAQNTGEYANFDLSDGSIGDVGNKFIDAKATSVGSGWYRLSVVTTSGANAIYLSLITSKTAAWLESFTGANATDGLYIQDAQLEAGLVATDYIETGASTAQAGILEDMPRLDYSGSCPALLLEPQRTNFVTDSEYFENYTKTDSSVTSNSAISPEGLENATKLFDGTGSAQHYIGNVGIGYFTNTDIRGTSVFVKAGTLDYMQLRLTNFGGTFSYYLVNVNLNNGSVSLENSSGTTNLSNSVEDYGNGWYRVSIACSFTNSNVIASRTEIYTAKNNNHTYTGTGTDYILIYGAQAESGSYPTSYIPTYGSSVTRSADSCTATSISNLIGQTQGTLFVEADLTDISDSSTTRGIAELNDGGTFNRISLFRNSNGTIRLFVRVGGIAQMDETFATPPNGNTKIGIGYASNDIVLYVNGTQVASDTSATIPACSDFDLGVIEGNLTKTLGNGVKQTALFKTRLTNAELAALTTI